MYQTWSAVSLLSSGEKPQRAAAADLYHVLFIFLVAYKCGLLQRNANPATRGVGTYEIEMVEPNSCCGELLYDTVIPVFPYLGGFTGQSAAEYPALCTTCGTHVE